MKVTYNKKLRETALAKKHGLVTVDILMPSEKAPGKRFGLRMAIQGPFTKRDCRWMYDVFLKLLKKCPK